MLILEFHAFCSAACMGTLVLKNPNNVLAGFALTLVDSVIKIYAAAVKSRNSERMVKNLNWLVSIRSRLDARIKQVQAQGQTPDNDDATAQGANAGAGGTGGDDGPGDDNDLELLGWKTRLIERAEAGLMRARTINPSPRDIVSLSPTSVTASAAPVPTEAQTDVPGGDLLVSRSGGDDETDPSSTSSGTLSRDRTGRSVSGILGRSTGGRVGDWTAWYSSSSVDIIDMHVQLSHFATSWSIQLVLHSRYCTFNMWVANFTRPATPRSQCRRGCAHAHPLA